MQQCAVCGRIGQNGTRAFYSAIGSTVDLMAPGGYFDGLVGISNNGTTSPSSSVLVSSTGTSFAAPLVAATAALIKAENPTLTPAQIRAAITGSARAFIDTANPACAAVGEGKSVCDCTLAACGAGMLDAGAALLAARSTDPIANASASPSGVNLVLDGASSTASGVRTIASYSWEQVSGATVLASPSTASVVNVPQSPENSDLVFKLTVVDSVGATHTSQAAFRVGGSVAPVGSSISSSSASSGGGAETPAGSGGGGGGSMTLQGLMGLALLLVWYRILCRRLVQVPLQNQSHQAGTHR
ncbi:MAG: S8 family serine peptidase [Limnobacter sp.]|nr:S8 family serine peptidase [Limnobacter sp.]